MQACAGMGRIGIPLLRSCTCTRAPISRGGMLRQWLVYGDAQGRSSYADARMGQGMAAGGYALVGGYAMPARGAAQLPPGGPGSCHVGNMPPDADKLYLYERFAPHGAIVSVKVAPLAMPECCIAMQCNSQCMHVDLRVRY